MIKVLANDGISESGIASMKKGNMEVLTTTVPQDELGQFINEQDISVLLVRSATKVRKELIDACPDLKIIGRGGVGMDNIDVEYAKIKGIHVINTPAASSISVAELVFSHLFGMVRFIHDSNRSMPLEGGTKFKELKKKYAKGKELKGKTLGLFGLGRIGKEVAKIAIGIGMKVIATDRFIDRTEIPLEFYDGQSLNFQLQSVSVEEVLKKADFITLHVPAQEKPVLGKEEFKKMKQGIGIINAARGGIIDEDALLEAIHDEKVSYAGLDVFENEPNPKVKLLMNSKLSLTPHIGAATIEAQERIGIELAEQIKSLLINS